LIDGHGGYYNYRVLRAICCQPVDGSLILFLQAQQTAVKLGQWTRVDDVWHCLDLSAATQFAVGETPFLVARNTVAAACPKTIQQWPLTSVKIKAS